VTDNITKFKLNRTPGTSTSKANSLTKQRMDELRIIYPGMKNRDLLNIYRDMRNKLFELSDRKNFVCVVSALADDGDSSLLALNLASVLAFDRSRSALVVDCDTRRGILDEICDQKDGIGLIDFIEQDDKDISVLIHESGISRVKVIPSGDTTDTRTESLESTRMRDILSELKKQDSDRYIIINAPSMELSSEVQILSNVCDMFIFQFDPGTIVESQLSEAIEMIGRDKIAGIVMCDS
jgi:protein-tyrosine kinase